MKADAAAHDAAIAELEAASLEVRAVIDARLGGGQLRGTDLDRATIDPI